MKTKKIKIIKVIVCAMFFWGLFFGFTPGIQAKLVSLGVLAFQDETGTGIPPDLGIKISRDLQQKLVKSFPDLLPRVIGTAMPAQSFKQMTVSQLASYGKQQGLDFLVRGGVLAASTQNIGSGVKVSIQLYAQVISVESADIKSVRAKGVGTQRGAYPSTNIPWEAIDVSGGEFQYSAPGMALLNAVEQLAGSVHEAVVSPFQGTVETGVPGRQTGEGEGYQTPEEQEYQTEEYQTTGDQEYEYGDEYQTGGEEEDYYSYQDEDADETESEEDLQQLIYQAEELIYNSSAGSEDLGALSQALEKLKESLNQKVTLMEQGGDTSQVEQDISQQKQELQRIISKITEEAYSGESEYEYETPSEEKKSLLSSVGGYLDDSLNIIEKIKEIRSTLRGARDEGEIAGDDEYGYESEDGGTVESDSESGAEGLDEYAEGEPEEEPSEEVTGVVTEDGSPVEGVTVTDPETGVSTTTDSSGYYNLGKIPAGRLSEIVISKQGKELAKGKVDLVPGRAAVADWELKPRFSKSKTPALRIIPSAVNVSSGKDYKKYKGKTGTIKGVVLDAGGKPMSRVLVKLPGLGSARTDSRGQYLFSNVPPGPHQLTVIKSGLNPKTQSVTVISKKTIRQKILFTVSDRAAKKVISPKLISHGTATVLWGMVTDKKNRPVRSAKVTVVQYGRAISVSTGPTGKYKFKDLKPGKYRVLVSKTGYKKASDNISLRAGKTERSNFKLEPSSPYVQSILGRQKGKTIASKKTTPVKKKPGTTQVTTTVPQVRLPGKGKLTGRVIDSKTKKPVSSATVYVKGFKGMTDRNGNYTVSNVPPGTHKAVVGKSGYYGQSKNVKIKANRSTRKNFALNSKAVKTTKSKSKPKTPPRLSVSKPAITKTKPPLTVRPGQIKGFVADSRTRKPIARAVISISGRQTSTIGNGSFVSPKLPPGTYKVSVSKAGYSGSTKTVTVRAGKTSSVSIYLSSRVYKKR